MPRLDAGRELLDSRRNQAVAAFVLYVVLAMGYFGIHVLGHFGSVCVCQPGPSDSSIFMWSLAWWPHALLHGMNPFVSTAVFVPDHVNIGAVTSIPGAALVLSPITLLFGPVASYNVLMLAAPVLAAVFAFLLCRYVTGRFAAALVGGYLFGFSAYMFGEMLGHAHMVLIFPIPAAVHLMLRLIDKRISTRRFVVLMALALGGLLLFSTELALTFVLLSLVTLVLAYAMAPALRPRLLAALKPVLAAGLVALVLTSPEIYYALKGVPPLSPLVGDIFGGDALGFLVPTLVTRFGRQYFAIVSAGFSGADLAESGIYIGLPLALIVARYTITRWALTSTRVLVAMLVLVVVLLLGSHLHIAGHPTIPLPWKLIDHSLLRDVLPVRLSVFVFLMVGLIAAMWLAQARRGAWGVAKWVAAAASIAFVLPNIGSGLWHWAPTDPPLFSTSAYRTVLTRGETVLIVPWGSNGLSMLWQAQTGMWFRMAEGYLAPTPPPDYQSDPLMPALSAQAKPTAALVRSFLARRHVSAVILAPGAAPQWLNALSALGLKPFYIGGVLVYRV